MKTLTQEAEAKIESLNLEIKTMQDRKDSLNTKISELSNTLSDMENDPSKYFESEIESSYNDMLNEQYSEWAESAPFNFNDVATLYKEYAPTDYRVGFAGHSSTYEVSNEKEYKELEEERDNLECDVCDIEEKIDELESEKDDLEWILDN